MQKIRQGLILILPTSIDSIVKPQILFLLLHKRPVLHNPLKRPVIFLFSLNSLLDLQYRHPFHLTNYQLYQFPPKSFRRLTDNFFQQSFSLPAF